MSGFSVWWPTPYRASRWFDEQAIEASERYHRPLRRAAAMRLGAQLGLVSLAQIWLLTRPASENAGLDWVVSSLVLALGWWLPAAAVDSWFEFHHEPIFGHVPLAGREFMVGSAITFAASVAVVLGTSLFLRGVTSRFPERWWLFVAIGLMVSLTVLAIVGAALSRVGHRIEPLEDTERFAEIGGEFGLDVSYARIGSDALPGLNALTIGWRKVDVVVTTDLLNEPDELQRHVVAHELSHVRHRDTVTSLAATVVIEGFAIGLLAMALPIEFASDGRRFPTLIGLALAVASVVRIGLAWLSRAHERRADLDAHRLVGPTPEWALRRLHLTDRADLCPPWWVRLVATHPTPGERLELARTERAGALRSTS